MLGVLTTISGICILGLPIYLLITGDTIGFAIGLVLLICNVTMAIHRIIANKKQNEEHKKTREELKKTYCKK